MRFCKGAQCITFALLLLFACPALAEVEGGSPLRILPLGDSLTYGLINGEPEFYSGYRGFLEQKLTAAHVAAIMVGTQKDEQGRWHEGHNGWQMDQIDAIAPKVLAESKPDIILLLIGTNDLLQMQSQEVMQQRMGHLLDTIHHHAAQARVYVASIPPVYTIACIPYLSGSIAQLNSMIQQAVQVHAARGEDIRFVDMYHDSKLACSDMNDGVHPIKVGYEKMAGVWIRALVTTLSRSNSTP